MKPAEIRNTEREIQQFRSRLLFVSVCILLCFILLLSRFVWLQVIRYEDYHAHAEENRISIVPAIPNRGLIFDRNGTVLARNYSAYTLEITPDKIQGEIDTLIDRLSLLIEIQAHHKKRFKKLLEESRNFESIPIRTRLSDQEVARFAAQRFRFPGVDIKARLFREYPQGSTAAHVIGYIGRISSRDLQKIEEMPNGSDYRGTEYIGKVGVEQSYEDELHGTTGFEQIEVTAAGRAVRTLSSTTPVPGNNLYLSLDIKLQQLAEKLFSDRRGALVAIEPASGDILAFVSSPTFDPNLFVEGIDQANWDSLNNNEDKPLLNRPLRGLYPPGSTYKPFMALAALELGKRNAGTIIYDPGYFMFGGNKFRDSNPSGHGPVDLHKSIVVSSDVYYYTLANELGIEAIHDFMQPWGFGQLTGIDLGGEKAGVLPNQEWKRRAFKNPAAQKWFAGETISVGIGQGYNSFTILQLAHATSTLANNGIVMRPHVVKIVENSQTRERRLTTPTATGRINLKPQHLEIVKAAMVDVNRFGTSAAAFAGTPYAAAGKTGTAQVIGIKQGEKYDAARIAERHRDHSLYMAFAPAEQPKIALAIIVENGGFGARAAAPIARKVFDYWLLGKLPTELAQDPTNEASSSETDLNDLGLPIPLHPDEEEKP
jgi:penicillin-binding protein 2